MLASLNLTFSMDNFSGKLLLAVIVPPRAWMDIITSERQSNHLVHHTLECSNFVVQELKNHVVRLAAAGRLWWVEFVKN